MPEGNQLVAMLLLGMAIGSFIPRELPAPASAVNPYMPFMGFVFLLIAIVMFVKH